MAVEKLARLFFTGALSDYCDDDMLGDVACMIRKSAQAHDVTGIFLAHDVLFLHIVEGRTEDVIKVFREISLDPLYEQVTLLRRHRMSHRMFHTWDMGVLGLHPKARGRFGVFELTRHNLNLKLDESPFLDIRITPMLRLFSSMRGDYREAYLA